jgi:LysM repeat protein
MFGARRCCIEVRLSRRRPLASVLRASRLLAAIVLLALLGLPGEAAALTHKVAEGQSLWKIAKRYNVTVDAIVEANGLDEKKPIRPGMVLEIPDKDGKVKSKPKPKPEAPKEPTPDKSAESDGAAPAKAKSKDAWVLEKPPQGTQTQKSVDARGGINPCLSKDPGFGVYEKWTKSGLSFGQALIPGRGGLTKSGQFDVMFHFHGHDPARKEWVKVMDGAVFVGVTLGIGSGVYSQQFSNPEAFKRLISQVEQVVAEHHGRKSAKVRKVGLSAWSAGYGAVEQILSQKLGQKLVDTVILLDGLHSGYGGTTLDENQLKPFVDFAKQAKAGKKFMFVSHSSIIPPGYASTYETASYLIYKLGGKPKTAKPRGADPMGLELIRRWDSGNFHVRGYRGNDKMDHCAHIGLLKDVVKVHTKPRWNTPKGFKSKS